MMLNYTESFSTFIRELISSNEFWNAQYYLLCMKKAPHGGVFTIDVPNYFIKYHRIAFFRFYVHQTKIPLPVKIAANLAEKYFGNNKCDIEELLRFCFWDHENSNDMLCKLYLANCCNIISPKNGRSKDEYYFIRDEEPDFLLKDRFNYDLELLFSLFVMLLSDYHSVGIECLNDIIKHEKLIKGHDKYGLTNVTDADFGREGLSLNGQYYLYNIFFDTSIGGASHNVPKIIDLMKKAQADCQIWMRCDTVVCVPCDKKVQIATTDMQKWRGISLDFTRTKDIIKNHKEIIVHADAKGKNKLLLSVLKENDYYSISVEQIWHPNVFNGSKYIMTNFIHGCYYPLKEQFDHIDFSINQFTNKVAAEKNLDASTITGTPIEKYGDEHYKIWCVKGGCLDVKLWGNLVYAALDMPFRPLFLEMVHGVEIEQL